MCRMETAVKNKFGSWDVGHPIVMMRVSKESEMTFNFLVGSLCLAIRLRVIHSGEHIDDTKFGIEGLHQACCELWTSIRNNLGRNAVKLKDFSIVNVCHSFRIDV